jgi:TetR/AcrR family transcriptional regulator, cholesterol catabolism regulator
LAVNPRARRIVDTAIDLAEKGGFEAVRLRDVAAEADVALGTLYRYFRSKEDMLIAALNSEVESLEARIQAKPMPGDTPLARVDAFFRAATKGLMRRPRLARAILRAAASGDHELAEKVAAFHFRMSAMILAAMHGEPVVAQAPSKNGDRAAAGGRMAAEDEMAVAGLLQHIWFSCLIGWAGGLMNQNEVIERMATATALLTRGASAE